jgi:hypothetical protein
MKIWNSYGSEHSANLVMIGKFKDAASAESAQAIIDELTAFISDREDEDLGVDRYPDGVLDLLSRMKFHSVAPEEIKQFRYDVHSEVKADKIVITTDEVDISAFLKLLIEKGARVEVYSAHEYPDTGEGR